MISIVMVARNLRQSATNCILSLLASVAKIGMETQVEYVFVDDTSDPAQQLPQMMIAMRGRTTAPVRIVKFIKRQHYTRALAHAFSMTRGTSILFVSHDMIVTPAYIRVLLAVAALDDSFGAIRGTSNHIECFPGHVIAPTVPLRAEGDINAFAQHVAVSNGLIWVEDPFLSGDSMLIRPAALEKAGVLDPRYPGFFGDTDYGLRLRRAGLKLICAKGAWLMHEGGGHFKYEAATLGANQARDAQVQLVNDSYQVFARKWHLPQTAGCPGIAAIDFAGLAAGPAPEGGDFQSRVTAPQADYELL